MKTASIYKWPGGGYLVFSQKKTISGVRIASEPFINISEATANVDIIANAIKASLCNDDTNRVPNPENWKEFNKIFLERTGLKSFKQLDNPENKLVSISEDKGTITFTPMQPAKEPDKGFVNTTENITFEVVNTVSNQEIVTAYELALDYVSKLRT